MTRAELRLLFHFVVVRTGALDRYPGGVEALARLHGEPRSADGLLAWCAMGAADLQALVDDLRAHGLGPDDAFAATWDPVVGALPGTRIQDQIHLPDWLTGRFDPGGLLVGLRVTCDACLGAAS
jgi:hypothetical protein